MYTAFANRKKEDYEHLSLIEKIDFQKFAMPLVVKIDNEYYPGIVEKLADLVFELERCGASDKIVLAVKEYRKKIISSIILYYQGDLVDAQLIVNEMLDEFNDAAPAITDINSSIAFLAGDQIILRYSFSEQDCLRMLLSSRQKICCIFLSTSVTLSKVNDLVYRDCLVCIWVIHLTLVGWRWDVQRIIVSMSHLFF